MRRTCHRRLSVRQVVASSAQRRAHLTLAAAQPLPASQLLGDWPSLPATPKGFLALFPLKFAQQFVTCFLIDLRRAFWDPAWLVSGALGWPSSESWADAWETQGWSPPPFLPNAPAVKIN